MSEHDNMISVMIQAARDCFIGTRNWYVIEDMEIVVEVIDVRVNKTNQLEFHIVPAGGFGSKWVRMNDHFRHGGAKLPDVWGNFHDMERIGVGRMP